MPNIKFSYLYRDSSNYKYFGYVVFYSPDNLSLEAMAASIQTRLIDGTWFYADEWDLPDLRPMYLEIDNDPTWHEFESVEFTLEEATRLLLSPFPHSPPNNK